MAETPEISNCDEADGVVNRMRMRVLTIVATAGIRAYRARPWRRVRCRRSGPSCSSYALATIRRYGLADGGLRATLYLRDHSLTPADVEQVIRNASRRPAPVRPGTGLHQALLVLGLLMLLGSGSSCPANTSGGRVSNGWL